MHSISCHGHVYVLYAVNSGSMLIGFPTNWSAVLEANVANVHILDRFLLFTKLTRISLTSFRLGFLPSKRRRSWTCECFPMGTTQSWRRHHFENAIWRRRFNWPPASRFHGDYGSVSVRVCWSSRVCPPPHVDEESLCDSTKYSTHIPHQSCHHSWTGTREPRYSGSWRRCPDGAKGLEHNNNVFLLCMTFDFRVF